MKNNNKQPQTNSTSKENESPPVIDWQRDYEPSGFKKTERHSNGFWVKIKPIFLAVISAVAIGIVLGSIMLNLFTTVKNDSEPPGTSPASIQTTEENDEEESKTNRASDHRKETEIKSMQAYVIQGGVFKEQPNAEEWLHTFQTEGHNGVIWNRDDEFYVILGLFTTKEKASRQVIKIKEQGLDAFVKQWTTDSVRVNLNEEEEQLVLQFQEIWLHFMKALETHQLNESSWEDKLNKLALEKESFIQLHKKTSDLLQDLNQKSAKEVQFALLKAWHHFDEAIREEMNE
ncbi:SPOR domain-containing protein [Virgibacillus sp. W0430]|uniref:SPOR domain-containing protein n=1 Tax=Virgibacillus sp. W0430 TaxID=3391580 RepID=UPI003F480BDA